MKPDALTIINARIEIGKMADEYHDWDNPIIFNDNPNNEIFLYRGIYELSEKFALPLYTKSFPVKASMCHETYMIYKGVKIFENCYEPLKPEVSE